MASVSPRAEAIVDCALDLAESRSWEAVRLADVARATGLSLEDIRGHFAEKEDVVEAWFDRADRAMLEDAAGTAFRRLPPRQRVHRAIMAWLTALAPHRGVTRQMILGKCEPGHLHVQIPGLLRVSRTVQWVREAAGRDATYLHRALEESVLTSIYLMTFIRWMGDDSPDAALTRRLLDRLLGIAEGVEALALGRRSSRRRHEGGN